MGDVFVPSKVLGVLFMSTMQGHVSQPKVHCPDHCVQCNAVLWLADNAPDMVGVAVRNGADIEDWQWMHTDGTVDWQSVRAMFQTPEGCLDDDHHVATDESPPNDGADTSG